MRISIIIISKDDCEGFRRSIESIQPYIDDSVELILVISDKRREYAKFLAGLHYSHLVYNEDFGLYNAMNLGVNCASGEYINFLNGGDTFSAESPLEVFFSKLSGDLVCFNVVHKDEIVNPGLNGVHPHQGIFYRTEILKKEAFDDSFKIHGDMDHWYRIKRKYRLSVINFEFIYAVFEGGGIGEKFKLLSAFELLRIGLRYKSLYRILSALKRLI